MKKRATTFVVQVFRTSEFPLDMLRYDNAEPATADDQAMIDLLNNENADKSVLSHRVSVKLTATAPGAPHVARWESFGCAVVECSDPTVALSPLSQTLDPDAARRRAIQKVAEAVLRLRGRLAAADPVYAALREAAEVAAQDPPFRERAIGVCEGISQTLKLVDVDLDGARVFKDALDLTIDLLTRQSAPRREDEDFADVMTNLAELTVDFEAA